MPAIASKSVTDALSELCIDEDTLDIAASITLHAGILLNYTQRAIPDFTNHGALHTVNVINNLCQILDGYPYTFTDLDRLLLGVAAVVHDFGCISERENHAETSVRILEMDILRDIRDLLSQESFRYLRTIVRSHSSSYDLKNLFNSEHLDRRLVLLCCIFRIADECDHSSERVSELVFDIYKELQLLKPEQEEIWSEHLEIEKITMEGTRIAVHVKEGRIDIPWIQKLDREVSIINSALQECDFKSFTLDIRQVPSI